MSGSNIKLVSFKAESFAKIDSTNPVIVVWPDDHNIVKLEGDQAVGKSSALAAFIACCGGEIIENAINKKDNKRKVEFEFKKNDRQYKVIITNTRFELQSLIEDDRWAKVPSPKQALQDILGPIGTSPMFLKNMSGKDQIAWLREFRKLSNEEEKQLEEINLKVKESYNGRKDAKRFSKQYDQELQRNDYYVNRAGWNKRFEEFDKSDANDIIRIQNAHQEYVRAEEGLKLLNTTLDQNKTSLKNIDSEIEELEQRLAKLKETKSSTELAINSLETRISTGTKYLEDNKSVVTEYNNIADIIKLGSEMATHKTQYAQMLEIEKKASHYHEEFLRLTAKLSEQRAAVKAFIAETFPRFDGLEIFVPSENIDDATEAEDGQSKAEIREGIYYKGASMSELSESELWSFYLVLLKSMNINVVVIENLSSLGSGAINMLNYYAEQGGYILATEMKREIKNLKIEVTKNII